MVGQNVLLMRNFVLKEDLIVSTNALWHGGRGDNLQIHHTFCSVLRLSAPSEEKSGIIKYNGDLENFSNKGERYGKH